MYIYTEFFARPEGKYKMGQNFFCTLQHKSAFTEQIVTKLATAGRHCVQNFRSRILLEFIDKIRKYASKNSSRQYVERDFYVFSFRENLTYPITFIQELQYQMLWKSGRTV